MAVKTRFSEDEFIAVLADYRLGEYQSAQPISAGTVQTNFTLHTTQGKYIFRCYENRSKESVQFECDLIQYLKARNYPCPAAMQNKQGKCVGVLREKPFVIFEFIEGEHLENPGEAQKKQLIQKVAELQNLTRHYKPRCWQYRWNYGPTLCRDLAQQAARRINTPNAWKKLEWFTGVLSELKLPRALPKGICHCDFHFSNILFKGGEFAALIDFDDANYTYLTYDLVTLMNPFIPSFEWDTWTKFERDADIVDLRESRAVAAEYMRYRPLSPVEKRHLFDVYKLSILFDCIWYYERGDVRDFYERRKIEALDHLGREGFYRQVF